MEEIRDAAGHRDNGLVRGSRTLIVGLLFLAAVVVVALRLGDARDFARLLQRAKPLWLLISVALQVATYVCAGGIWWLVLRRTTTPQRLRTLALLAVGKVFTDQAFPSGGVAGDLFMLRALTRRSTPRPFGVAAVVVTLLGFYAALIASTAASLVFSWTRGHAGPVLVVMTAALLLVAFAVSSILFVLVRARRSRAYGWLVRLAPLRTVIESFAEAPRDAIRDPVSLAGSIGLQFVTIALDASTLYATLASVGEHAPAGSVFASFVFAKIAEITGMVPGGLGTFEATCVALLHVAGVGVEPALAATLLLRGFTFWLPMLPGLAVVRRELRRV
ncbi:MAG TPA: lysylphosphatidylglycerol synthase transmembrane domain-containing protein [Polyangiaceae bacterium]|nr:lysylphosphatidylglycerol synthase transmembrane domain-containing protein [Polyangiaceae bacterium]